MQIRNLTASVTQGSNVVGISGADVSSLEPTPHLLLEGLAFTIQSSTSNSVTLTESITGLTSGDYSAAIHQDFIGEFPLLQENDLEVVSVYNEAVRRIYNANQQFNAALADLSGVTDAAAARTALELKSAALRDIATKEQAENGDNTTAASPENVEQYCNQFSLGVFDYTHLYVDVTGGNDANDGRTSGNSVQSLNKALELANKLSVYTVRINVSNSTSSTRATISSNVAVRNKYVCIIASSGVGNIAFVDMQATIILQNSVIDFVGQPANGDNRCDLLLNINSPFVSYYGRNEIKAGGYYRSDIRFNVQGGTLVYQNYNGRTSEFLLNLGLRYDLILEPGVTYARISNWNETKLPVYMSGPNGHQSTIDAGIDIKTGVIRLDYLEYYSLIYANGDSPYHKANILGTVSQSAGTPTGAIIERGSDSNCEYTKYADGTVEFWSKGLTLSVSSNHYLNATWDLPFSITADETFVACNPESAGIDTERNIGVYFGVKVDSTTLQLRRQGNNGEDISSNAGQGVQGYAKARWY